MIGVCDCTQVPNDGETLNDGIGVFPYYLRSFNDRIIGYYGEPSFIQSNVSYNKWYHYVFIADESGGKIYVDGELIQTDNWTGTSGFTSNNLLWEIGGTYENNQYFKGEIDDIAIWNRSLTSEEILKIFRGDGF